MRVVTGSAKGRKLKVPIGQDIRPMTDMIKQAIFNVLGPLDETDRILDLFAGSGSMGIEALSRGAGSADFVEMEAHAVAIIRENLSACRFTESSRVYRDEAQHALGRFARDGERFTVIFVDPPFRIADEQERLLKGLPDVLGENGTIVLRLPTRVAAPSIKRLELTKTGRYGDSLVLYYQFAENE